jgi:quercetin dioxygenase-like cupin family protein
MTVIRSTDRRCTPTPNATMTTLASPTQGGSERSLWQVDAAAGAVGPVHVFDVEQTWSILRGTATVVVGDDPALVLAEGDTIVLAPGEVRRITADPDTGYTAVVTSSAAAVATVPGSDDGPVSPRWIA